MIHPTGFGGRPVAGQRRRALANASWTASSAASIEPQTRTSTDTARPYSRLNTSSIDAAVTPSWRSLAMLKRPYLDGQPGGLPGQYESLAEAPRPADSGIEVGCVDHGGPSDVFLRLDR